LWRFVSSHARVLINELTDRDWSQNVFALIFVMTFFFPSFYLIKGMVVEKETKIREGMRMMVRAPVATNRDAHTLTPCYRA
jgi:flagellar biogenesis protein FliO